MEIKDIIAALRRGTELTEADASEKAYAMVATVKGKHPRLKISAVVVDGLNTTICLANGTQIKFDPTLPVPIWKYPESMQRMNPKTKATSFVNVLNRLYYLQLTAKYGKTTKEKEAAQIELDAILKKRGAKSIDELETRIHGALAAERGETAG
jgi:hypothetical protein